MAWRKASPRVSVGIGALAAEQVGDQFARRGRMHRPIGDEEGAGSGIEECAAEAGSRFGASGGVKASGRTAHRQ